MKKILNKLNSIKGFSLVEVVIAMVLITVITLGIVQLQYFMSKHSVKMKDKVFATQKVMQMMEELRSLVVGAERERIRVLDDFEDVDFNTILTTQNGVNDPAAPLSGNISFVGNWKYIRKVTVDFIPGEAFARRVHVQVCRNCPVNPGTPREVLAEASTILRTISAGYRPTQVYDVYVIAIENIPGWWTSVPQLRGIFTTIVQDMEIRNPGLTFRVHWITRSSYGRDPYYRPYINDAVNAQDVTAVPFAYLYPGLITDQNGNPMDFFDESLFHSRINVDGNIINRHNYALCDQYNHAVRYPEELATFANLRANPNHEISLRMLIEQMYSNPDNFRNALILNLHGELLPLPAMRNYSDPAKDPATGAHRGIRAVTHPERLRYENTEDVRFRVYSYVTDPDNAAFPGRTTMPNGQPISVYFPNDNIRSADIEVSLCELDDDKYQWEGCTNGDEYLLTHPNTNDTLIELRESPIRHGPEDDDMGLSAADRLYGMEYIPCAFGNPPSFNRDLTDENNRPKNTARWTITIDDNAALNTGALEVQTFFGNTPNTHLNANRGNNISRTYVWINQDPPITERFQFLGDPRHYPYIYENGDTTAIDYQPYNWYFTTNFTEAVYGKDSRGNGWGGGPLSEDVPRYFMVFREALMRANAIFTTLNGYSFYYIGIGGEFGADMPPLSNGCSMHERPWEPNSNNVVNINEITWTRTRVVAREDVNDWISIPWLGELYPDDDFITDWMPNGNLPTGPGNYVRVLYSSYTAITNNRVRRTDQRGCVSFANGGSGGNAFDHIFTDGEVGPLQTLGSNTGMLLNIPFVASINARRAFSLNDGSRSPEWNEAYYTNLRTTLSVPQIPEVGAGTARIFYEAQTSQGNRDACSAVRMERADNGTVRACNILYSGLGTQTNVGTALLGQYALCFMLRTFLDGGQYFAGGTVLRPAGPYHIPQVPLVNVITPAVTDEIIDPNSITIQWQNNWAKWDDGLYTEEYIPGYDEQTSGWDQLLYFVKYSIDNGATWRCMDCDGLAIPGGLNHAGCASPVNANTYNWDVSDHARFPTGNYVVRVECFRQNPTLLTVHPLHYSFDMTEANIERQ